MPTFKAIVLKHQIKADKTVNIKIRVIHNRKTRYLNTGLIATTADLTKAMKIKTQSFVDDTNETIKVYRDKCNKIHDKIDLMTIDQVIDFLSAKEESVSLDFIAFSNEYILKIQKEGRLLTARDYTTAINCLKRYINSDVLLVSQITMRFLNEFAIFIVENPINAKKTKKTTMSRATSHYLGSIRTLHNEMKNKFNDEDNGIIRIPLSPFTKLKVPKPAVTKKRAIDSGFIKTIYSLKDEAIKHSSGGSRFNLAKDCFILSFCLIGMNSADLYDCTDITKNNITYKRKKTRTRRNDKAEIVVELQPEIKALIQKYKDKSETRAFNFYQTYSNESNFNKAINKGLKTVGTKIKVDDLEFYAARHSWATIALNKAGIDKYTVHSALNHVDDAMKVTDIYLEKDWSLINNANRKVLDFVFKKKETPAPGEEIVVKPKRKPKKLTEPVAES